MQNGIITTKSLQHLLGKASNLTSLNLDNCTIIGDISKALVLESHKLLESVIFPKMEITAPFLQNLLGMLNNLETLDISCCTITGDINEALPTGSLRRLALHKTMAASFLYHFLEKATKLKVLDLSACTITGDINEVLPLKCLETVNLGNGRMSAKSLQNLLENAKNLQRLDLHSFTLDGDISAALPFESLKIVSLRRGDISGKSMQHLLCKAKNLQELDVSEATITGDISEMLPLEFLETFKLRKGNISGKSLQHLLGKAKYLVELDLSEATITGDISEAPLLESLEKIVLQEATISAKSLLNLIGKAKNIKELDLYGCTITGELDEEFVKKLAELKKSRILKNYSPNAQQIKTGTRPVLLNAPEVHEHAAATGHHSKPWTQDPISLDANTKPEPDKKFDIEQIFYVADRIAPAVNEYRQTIYNTIEINPSCCEIGHAFTLGNDSNDLKLVPCEAQPSDSKLYSSLNKDKNQYFGKQTLMLGKEWQPLASLSPYEKMLVYHVPEQADIEIQYSKRDNLYYIRDSGKLKRVKLLIIEWVLEIPEIEAAPLPNDIQKKIKKYQQFKSKELQVAQKEATGQDYLDGMEQQQTGACRHRTLLFKAWMTKHHPEYKTRIVNNDCHSFVEVRNKNGLWIRHDLGGYPAELKVHQSNNPNQDKEKPILPVIEILDTSGAVIPVSEKPLPPKKTWFAKRVEPQLAPISIPSLYMQKLLAEEGKNKLLNCQDTQSIQGFRHHLQDYCKKTKRPCFYVHSKEDMVCAASWILHKEDNTGIIQKDPGGALHRFLTETRDENQGEPILIINYDAFSSQDIVRFNALLDTRREADGTPLPETLQVIGLRNPDKYGAYHGADFISRFDGEVRNCPFNAAQLAIPEFVQQENNPANKRLINFYGMSDWEGIMLGRWEMQGSDLIFKEGALLEAIRKQETGLILANAPWDNEEFVAFWQQTMLYGHFQVQGKTWHLPEDFAPTRQHRLLLDHALDRLTLVDAPSEDAKVLNPGVFSRFQGEYVCKDNALYRDVGLIEKHAGKTLSLYLTATLTEHAFAMLLDDCERHNVSLRLALAPSVILPSALTNIMPTKSAETVKKNTNRQQTHTRCIQSADPDVRIQQLLSQEEFKDALEIDVSEVTSSDLLSRLVSRFDKEKLVFHFSEEPGALATALENDLPVILKGVISKELRDGLSRLLWARSQSNQTLAPLVIVSQQPLPFTFLPVEQHTASLEEKKAQLTNHNFDSNTLEKYSLSELKAMQARASVNPNEAWGGFDSLPPSPEMAFLSLDNSVEEAHAFNQKRMNAVTSVLESSPFVFLAGVTGVGKSTFVQKVWGQEHPNVHMGEASLLSWALDDREGIKTLFIDEANIGTHNWSQFEGLFQDPPGILIGNKWEPLSKTHKVIFAGNPLSYGGERQMPTLFKRHGGSLIFDPMTPAYLFEELLKPVLKDFKAPEDIAIPILQVAEFLSHASLNEVLISPRELSMMALLTASYCSNNPTANPSDVARNYAYHLAQTFVPEAERSDFDRRFKPNSLSLPHEKLRNRALKIKDFTLTKNHEPAFDALCDILQLRSHRQNGVLSPTGGLGGLILEGEPGIGKTEFVARTLVLNGLDRKSINDSSGTPGFYIMPVSLSLSAKEDLLIKAFHEGSVVVIDEINSAPMMERLLNDLLMGNTPDGKNAKKPGFLVIGTQNPPTMAGRIRSSLAMRRRTMCVNVPPYSGEEMELILQKKGLPETLAIDLVQDYLSVRASSNSDLCFRDVDKAALQEMKALKKAGKRNKQELMLLQTNTDFESMFDKVTEKVDVIAKQKELRQALEKTKYSISDGNTRNEKNFTTK